ncbi:Ig-like domain-containing protein [soil metagenome]
MRRGWLSRHTSLAVTVASGAVVAALVVVAAVVSSGYTAQRVDLGDASVWVANSAQQYVGRANTEVLQLDTIVSVEGTQTDVVQQGATVIAVDTADARADIIDPATAQITKTVPLPPEQPQIYLAGSNVAVYSQGTGELWIMPAASFAAFDSEQPPTLNLGAHSVVSVDDAGMLYAYSSDVATVSRVDLATVGSVAGTSASTLAPAAGDRVTVTSAGRHWAVLDATTSRVEVDGTVVDLATSIGSDGTAVLQRASSSGSGVLIAFSGGLLSVPFGGGKPALLASGHSGVAAAPLVSNGCVFAAWTDSTVARSCPKLPVPDAVLRFTGIQAGARLAFQTNGSHVLLNDSNTGSSWAVQREAQAIDNWDDLINDDQKQTDVRPNDDTSETVVEKDQQPPVAIDDSLGARAARTTTLAVLVNDYDANGDVLVIDSATDLDPGIGQLDIIDQGQQLQVTLAAGAHGSFDFDYTISDGRGGTASATVTVTVRSAGQNSPPRQVRTTRATVEAGGQGSFDVLGDWVDPDGDPLYLTSATVAAPDALSYGPEGTVVVRPASSSIGRLAVALVVSDGTDEGTGSAAVTVKAKGAVPIVADPFVVQATAGQEVTISPLDHVHGGAGTVTLNAVPPRSGATVTPSYEAGTFRFESDQVRTHYIDFVVTDGISTVTGTVRVDVTLPPDVNSTPITVPKTVFVHQFSSATVNVAATDIDPAGGVLLVVGTTDPPAGSGVDTAVLNQESVRVTLTALLTAPVTFEYTVTNGLAQAGGTITVIQIPTPTLPQPPVARDDTATARVGDAIVIDVLANDEQPDGLDISLDPHLVEGLDGDSGLLFASGSTLRYLAPDHPGNFTAVYQVTSSNGQTAQAQVHIEVREPNLETNNAPVPKTVVARVLAGQAVRIDIPLTEIDPDGDSVQLIGQETNPQKGAVTDTGPAFLEYTAGDYSAGTDTFTYSVIDALGARASGTIRVGIAPKPPGVRNPIATPDIVVARPGSAVSVQVLANDVDPDGGALTVTSATPTDAATKAIIENGSTVVTITPPQAATDGQTFAVLYAIENASGGTDQAFVTVQLSSSAPLSYPVANDTTLSLSDVQGRTSVDVDVLRNVFFADGDNSTLGLAVLPGYTDDAQVLPDRKIRVTVSATSRIIPFVVAHPRDANIRSYAFIWVPGVTDALPQLARDAPALTVDSGQPLSIDLARYVVAAEGKTVHLTDSSTVQATHSNGAPLVVDDHTLRFTSAAHFSGPASISFEVTDGTSATDPAGHKATLVLPITVTLRDNAPPVFTGAVIEFEPGQEKVIDLLRLTDYPHPSDVGQLVYSVVAPLPVGFSYEVRGTKLTIRANENAHVGSQTGVTMSVRDNLAQGQPGRITLSVVSSTRPVVVPVNDVALVARGTTTQVDILGNDEATNPFPDKPLRVVAITNGEDQLPDGVTVVPSADRATLTVTVSSSADPGDSVLEYEVADATGDPGRDGYGTVRISVQDVPDAPSAPQRQVDQFVGGELKLRINPPQQNNSTITGYTIVSSSHGQYSQNCGLKLICSLTGLTVGAEYRFSVVATNGIGDSDPSALSDVYTVDYRPAAPSSVNAAPAAASAAPNGKAITVSWSSVPDPDPGTPVSSYTVIVSGSNVSYTIKDATSPLTTTAGGGLSNDTSYTVTVFARNAAQVLSEADWRRSSTTVRTVGPPSAPGSGPTATLTGSAGDVRVTWGDSDPNGAGSVTYSVGRADGNISAPACSTGSGKPYTDAGAVDVSSPWVDEAAHDGAIYTYVVYADNGIYCTSAATGPIESKQTPGQASGSVSVVYRATGQYDLKVNGDLSASGTVSRFEYRLSGAGAWLPVSAGDWLTSTGDTSHYGNSTAVTFRACRDSSEDYCGAESAASIATPVNVRATVTSCIQSSPLLLDPPRNGGGASVEYSVSYNQPIAGEDSWSPYSSYASNDPVPSDAVGVRARSTVTVGGSDYTDQPGYADAACTAP